MVVNAHERSIKCSDGTDQGRAERYRVRIEIPRTYRQLRDAACFGAGDLTLNTPIVKIAPALASSGEGQVCPCVRVECRGTVARCLLGHGLGETYNK